MIKIENTEVYGWEAAIRGMRNPLNSWEKSDSTYCKGRSAVCDTCPIKPDDDYAPCYFAGEEKGKLYVVGANDLNLMKKLVSAGSDHSKFTRMINVTCDITAPRYWWTEFDTYKVGTVRDSCSTMHKIADKEFTLDDFSHEHLEDLDINLFKIQESPCMYNFQYQLNETIHTLNLARKLYLQTKEKRFWWQIIQLLPQSYNQRATVQLNYQVLRNMYHARKSHKLDEWVDFCRWVEESLPYSELITKEYKNK